MANVALRNVHKTYPGGVEATKGIDFEVGDGQLCVLVGPSGCGKSTLLRMVAGLETITGGDIDIGGGHFKQEQPARPRPPHRFPKITRHSPIKTSNKNTYYMLQPR